MYACVHMCYRMPVEDMLWESLRSFHQVDPEDQIKVVRLGGKALPGEPSLQASFKFFQVNKMVT